MNPNPDDGPAAAPKRRLIPGAIALHPNDPAIVVHYTIQDPSTDPPTQAPATKVIAIKLPIVATEIEIIAADIVSKCKLIHEKKTAQVAALVTELAQRTLASAEIAQSPPPPAPAKKARPNAAIGARSPSTSSVRAPSATRRLNDGSNASGSNVALFADSDEAAWSSAVDTEASFAAAGFDEESSSATLDQLETYLEMLYEDVPEKLRAARSVLWLALNQGNLDSLAANEAMLPALSRTLREDGKRSMDLAAVLVAIFHQFARHPAFRALLSSHKVGDLCLKQLETEHQRLRVLMAPGAPQDPSGARAPSAVGNNGVRATPAVRVRHNAIVYASASVLVHLADEVAVQVKMVKRGIMRMLLELMIMRCGMSGQSASSVGTSEAAASGVVLQFLCSLTLYSENVDAVREIQVAGSAVGSGLVRLLWLIDAPHLPLQVDVLRLFLNLTHDDEWRAEMMKMGIVARLVDRMRAAGGDVTACPPEVFLLLYQISCDDRSKAIFTYTDALPLVSLSTFTFLPTLGFESHDYVKQTLELIVNCPIDHVPVELMTLAINLAINEHNAEHFAEKDGIKMIVKRAVRTRDYLLLKLLRNMAMHSTLHMMFLEHLDDLMDLFQHSNSPDVHVEIIGLLASLQVPDMDYCKLAETYQLVPYIVRRLASVKPQDLLTPSSPRGGGSGGGNGLPATKCAPTDDLALECTVLLATLATDDNMGPVFAQVGLPALLLTAMRAREDDDEMVLQMLAAFASMLALTETRAMLLPSLASPPPESSDPADSALAIHPPQRPDTMPSPGGLVACLIDLMYDHNPAIRLACDKCLDLIGDLAAGAHGHVPDQENVRQWAAHIRTEKFYYHNAEWIALMSSQSSGSDQGEDDEHEMSTARGFDGQQYQQEDEEAPHPYFVDHDDGSQHHAAEMFGHVKLVY
ncbi:kinesin-associated protein-domain-containing protein [Blastocladiella britannica]|nr:kinesin-associated protein-domain-containing protein [Blastocladiella britannica]